MQAVILLIAAAALNLVSAFMISNYIRADASLHGAPLGFTIGLMVLAMLSTLAASFSPAP